VAKLPWEKSLHDITPRDWLTAFAWHPDFCRRPSLILLAAELVRFANVETMRLWPSQSYLAQLMNCDRTQVSRLLKPLRERNNPYDYPRSNWRHWIEPAPVRILPIEHLSPEEAGTVRRDKRAKMIELDRYWVQAVFEYGQNARKAEPKHLKIGREKKERLLTGSVNNHVTGDVNKLYDGERHTKGEREIRVNRDSGLRMEKFHERSLKGNEVKDFYDREIQKIEYQARKEGWTDEERKREIERVHRSASA